MSRHASRAVRRAPVLAAVVAALVAGGLADRAGAPKPAKAAQMVEPGPVAAPADALSSSWFCAGATDGGPIQASGSVVIANDGAHPASATVTVVPSTGSSVKVPVQIGPHGSTSVPEAVPGGSPWVGAIVDVDGGSVAVAQVLQGLSASVSPCATSGSAAWYFATGQTRINADTAIQLLNPYPSDSIVDLSFSTNQGVEQPEDFQSIDVAPGALVTLDLGQHLRRRAAIATTVKARTGRVVAWETEWVTPPAAGQAVLGTPQANSPLADLASPVPGVEAVLGAPSTGTSWAWPEGLAGNGVDEQYVIYNPTAQTALVRLSLGLQQGAAEPFELSVGPYQTVPVISEQQARIPAGVAHDATLVSLNGTGVVATRSVVANHGPLIGGPARTGIADLPGGRAAARSWIVPAPAGGANVQGWVVVQNPSSRPVQVSLTTRTGSGTVPLPGAASASNVAARGSLAIAVPAGSTAPISVSATAGVFVEYDLYGGNGANGISASFAIPLS
ncbi:MAG: hypothetical protein JO337_10330 [Acidimicrobiales bacterium]|nr:hypothetical protein [Acidimicrobiales bacterium]